jgi:hypothetical protein
MERWSGTLVDDDVARFVVADSAVGVHTGGALPENWKQMAATIDADAAEIDDPIDGPLEQWWAREFVARVEIYDARLAGRYLSPEVSRRLVDPIIAAARAW